MNENLQEGTNESPVSNSNNEPSAVSAGSYSISSSPSALNFADTPTTYTSTTYTGGVNPHTYNWSVGGQPYWHQPELSMSQEIRIREQAIERTIKLFGDENVDIEQFAAMLDMVYAFVRYGTPIKVTEIKTTNTTNE